MINHPTTKIEDGDNNLEKIEGVALYNEQQERYELLALEHADSLIPGETALQLYQNDLEILYQDVHGNNAYDTGKTTWNEVKQTLDR